MSKFTLKEKSTLLYLETCLVDQYGRVDGRKLNDEDMTNILKFKEMGLIEFGRIVFARIKEMRKYGIHRTHWVRFSNKAWKLAHKWRKERSERWIARENKKLLKEIKR